jgi:ligand-binding sensor domain-containing protein/two-component sensor histidine kinase
MRGSRPLPQKSAHMNMKKPIVVLLGAFLFMMILSIYAVAAPTRLDSRGSGPDYGIDFWREAEGLSQSRIRVIVQTKDGYLWLGTDNGLVRFNGASFTAFTVETGSLRDNEVWAIQEDDEGGLWIGTYGGGLTLFKEGRFRTFTTADGLPDDVVTRLDKDREGNIWLITRNGAGRYSQGIFTRFTTRDGLADDLVTAICADSSQGVLLASGGTLQRLVDGKFLSINGVVEKREGQINNLLSGSDGSVWLGFHGLVKRLKDGVVSTYTWPHNSTPRINQLHEDPQGTLWVAMEQGVSRLRDGKFEAVPLGETNVGVVYSLCSDREGNIWLGFQSNGLGRLRTRQLLTISASDGLPSDSTRSVFQDSKGNVWIGTVDGFARYQNGKTTNYQTLNGARIGSVRSLAEDPRGNIWVGADQELLILRGGLLSKVPEWNWPSEIEVIYRDPKGHMWVGTDGDGLFEFDGGNVKHYGTPDGLASNQVRALLSDRHGALWISTFGIGISKYADGKFVTYTAKDGLAGNRVSAIHEDEEGALWFATREGLSRFKDGRFFNYTAECGLLVGFVYAILDDAKGNFWFSCAQGLFRVSKTELRDFAAGRIKRVTSIDYGVRDGMKTRACNVGDQPTAWKTTDGLLLFCTLKGVVIVDPKRLYASSLIPPVHIEKVFINKQEQQLSVDSQMALGTGEFEIHYAALSYVAPEKVRFKYKLEGFDKEWVDAGTRRFAYYANLPPGYYSFKVIAGHIDGPWNENGKSFAFYLKPHFYQTSLFLVLMIAGVLLLAGLLYRLRMVELKARYSAVLGERNRIAREIHDTLAQNLAGIALQLDSINMQSPDIPSGLRQRLDQACNLVRYSLSEARRAVSDLRSDELERRELATALPEIAERMTSSAALDAHVQVLGTPRRMNAMTEKNLLRIFQEAMANAVKHADARTIDVELRYGLDCLALSVRDDGSGFDTEKVIPLGVGHYGLTGMRERAERIGGRLTLKSKIGQGTELLVEVPLPT